MTISIQASEKIGSRFVLKSRDHDPGATTAKLASPDGGTTPWAIDMSQCLHLGVEVRPTVLAGLGITKVRLMMSLLATGASGVVIKDSGTLAMDSLNDCAFLEVSAQEVAQAAAADGVDYRYITVEITTSDATDEANVTLLQIPRHPRTGLTATVVT